MRLAAAALLCSLAACAGSPRGASTAAGSLVDIADIDKTVIVDIRYATPDNFTKKTLYPANRCLLRRPVARALARVQRDLKSRGLRLKVWDCYRPLSIQRKLWELVPDPRYVADPAKGSRHNRGAAVDLTLVDAAGRELEMPTGYDDFSEAAHRGFGGATSTASANSAALEEAMTRRGFAGLRTEWWHFDADGWKEYALEDLPLEPR